MSGIWLRNAVRDEIQEHLGLKQQQVKVMDDGRAPPDATQLFIAVHPGRWRRWPGWKPGPTLDEEFGCSVTVSAKNGAIQPQLWGELLLQKETPITSCGVGIEAVCREIVTRLSNLESLMCVLNTLAGATQFTGGLYFADGGIATAKQADWWMCGMKDRNEPAIGWAQTIQFDGVRRTQASGSDAT